jgi:hypothetical protein
MVEQAQTRSDPASGVDTRALLPPRQRRLSIGWVALALAMLALVAGGWWYQRSRVPAPPEVQALPLPPQAEAPTAAASAPSPAAPATPLPEPKAPKARWTKPA